MKSSNKKFSYILVILSLGAFLVGCGKSEEELPPANAVVSSSVPAPAPVANVSGCQPGFFKIGNFCAYGSTFEQACASVGVLLSGGVCQVSHKYISSSGGTFGTSLSFSLAGSQFPILHPASAPAGENAFRTGFEVKRGDKLYFAASGSWGYDSYCDDVYFDGTRPGGGAARYENELAGLWGSDGVQAFFLDATSTSSRSVSVSALVINNDGTFRFGINADPRDWACAKGTITRLEVKHCEIASGVTVQCP